MTKFQKHDKFYNLQALIIMAFQVNNFHKNVHPEKNFGSQMKDLFVALLNKQHP